MSLLKSFHVTGFGDFFISGATVADALSIGYRTILIDDCCRGVDLNDIEKTKNNVVKNHGVIVQSNEVSFKNVYKKQQIIIYGIKWDWQSAMLTRLDSTKMQVHCTPVAW